MNWCKIIGHKFGGFYLKDINGEYFDPIVFTVPYGEAIDVYKKCSRCGKIYGHTQWGNPEKFTVGTKQS